MTEPTPSSNDASSHSLRTRTHREKQSGQQSLLPKRGLLKRSKGATAPDRTDGSGQATRAPLTREQSRSQPQTPSSVRHILAPSLSPSSPANPSQRRPALPTARPTANRKPPGALDDIRLQQSSERLEQRAIAAEQKRQADIEKKRQQEELAASREAEKARRAEKRAQALKIEEEQRVLKQKAFELRKAEAERIRFEKEVEAKRIQAERLKKKKEDELKRLEEEKIFQAKELLRIVENIETCCGQLNEKERILANTIANEMVKRKIIWNGYISLHSGIGGAMLS
ncbi:MAG: hypothetical protein HQ517_09990 [SAR324 cluster bacterium]|nr:hypothetical protein [SAR324 cluster bacterium]